MVESPRVDVFSYKIKKIIYTSLSLKFIHINKPYLFIYLYIYFINKTLILISFFHLHIYIMNCIKP